MKKRISVGMFLLLAVVCTALILPLLFWQPAAYSEAPTITTKIETLDKTAFVPTPKVSTNTATFTSTSTRIANTSTPLPSFTPTFTATSAPTYVYTNTVNDAYEVAKLLGLKVRDGSKCIDPVFRLSNGKCFEDIGDYPSGSKLNGPYFIGLFHELGAGPVFVTLRFFVIKWPDGNYMPRHDTLGVYADRESLFEKKWTRAKGETWVYPAYLWEITPEQYEVFASKGMEFKVTDWYEIFGP